MSGYGEETAAEMEKAYAAAPGTEAAPASDGAHVRKLQRELKRALELHEKAAADLETALAEKAAVRRAEELDGLRLAYDRLGLELRAANQTAQGFAEAAAALREALAGALTTIAALGRLATAQG